MGAAKTASPAKVGPQPLTVDELDRDELLALIKRLVPPFYIKQRDILYVRWHVLAERSIALGDASVAASQAACTASDAIRTDGGWQRYKDARAAAAAAERRAQRADRAQKRAWAALEAC